MNRNLPDPKMITRTELGEPVLVRNWLAADLGQAADYTAIIAGQTFTQIERTYGRLEFAVHEDLLSERAIASYRVVNAHRPQLGTSYPIIAAQIDAFLDDLQDADLIVDATGVGRGVVDILRSRGLKPIAITITGGSEVISNGEFDFRVPKVDLVGALIATSQEGKLRISPSLALADVLASEISAFSPRLTATGHTTFEGRDGTHDDLVLALAIGIWHQSRPRPRPAHFTHFNFIAR